MCCVNLFRLDSHSPSYSPASEGSLALTLGRIAKRMWHGSVRQCYGLVLPRRRSCTLPPSAYFTVACRELTRETELRDSLIGKRSAVHLIKPSGNQRRGHAGGCFFLPAFAAGRAPRNHLAGSCCIGSRTWPPCSCSSARRKPLQGAGEDPGNTPAEACNVARKPLERLLQTIQKSMECWPQQRSPYP